MPLLSIICTQLVSIPLILGCKYNALRCCLNYPTLDKSFVNQTFLSSVNLLNNVIYYYTSYYFRVRLVSLATQKFISEIANDALQHCKTRGANQNSKTKGKDRRYTLTMEDLTPAVAEYGIIVKKPHYFV